MHFFAPPTAASSFKAFSLKEAQRALLTAGGVTPDLLYMGGITKPVGIVYDEQTGDIIVVGEVDAAYEQISLDEFVIALRAILKHGKPPLVSIDRVRGTEATGEQDVRFEGGIENTRFGKYLLDADVVLKKMGLGKLAADIWGVRSYFDMSAESWKNTGVEDPIISRFWFVPNEKESFVAVRKAVAVVKKLSINVMTEVVGVPVSNGQQNVPINIRDGIGDQFANAIAANLGDISTYYSELRRLDPLFRLTGLAEGIRRWQQKFGIDISDLSYWINEYHVKIQETPKHFSVISSEATREKNGNTLRMTISGGIV